MHLVKQSEKGRKRYVKAVGAYQLAQRCITSAFRARGSALNRLASASVRIPVYLENLLNMI
jgi:hypothetical protein